MVEEKGLESWSAGAQTASTRGPDTVWLLCRALPFSFGAARESLLTGCTRVTSSWAYSEQYSTLSSTEDAAGEKQETSTTVSVALPPTAQHFTRSELQNGCHEIKKDPKSLLSGSTAKTLITYCPYLQQTHHQQNTCSGIPVKKDPPLPTFCGELHRGAASLTDD